MRRILLFLIFVGSLAVTLPISGYTRDNPTITIEAGEEFYASMFSVRGESVYFMGDFARAYVFDGAACIYDVGDFLVHLLAGGYEVTIPIRVTDRIAPRATIVDKLLWDGMTVTAEECVTDIDDATKVTCTFLEEPDFETSGVREATIRLTDRGGNYTDYTATFTIRNLREILAKGITIEAGEPIPKLSEVLGPGKTGSFVTRTASINTYLAEDYTLELKIDDKRYKTQLHIVDTAAPVAMIEPQTIYRESTYPEASSFVSKYVDAGPVTVTYEMLPESIGEDDRQVPVAIRVTDQGGNFEIYDSFFIIREDDIPPVIVNAPDMLEIDAGNEILWRTLTEATDNSGEVTLSLDTSKASLGKAGNYTVTIVATDKAGNEARRDVLLKVHDGSVTAEQMEELAAQIMSEILTEGMTVQEQLYAVYKYIGSRIRYVTKAPQVDERREAYLALTSRRKGNCFTYYAAGRELLTYLGYDVIMIRRADEYVPVRGNHFWCLVNCGTAEEPKWYHFDACPHGTLPEDTYMFTDEQAWAYTNKWNDRMPGGKYYYSFDPSLYPASATERMYEFKIEAKYYERYYPPRR